MNQFAPGDRVVVAEAPFGCSWLQDKPGEIMTVFRDTVSVRMDTSGSRYTLEPWRLRLRPASAKITKPAAPKTPGKYILILRKDGKLLPAATPREYDSEEQAIHVGTAMAEKYGGLFEVFRAVVACKAPPPVKPSVIVTRI